MSGVTILLMLAILCTAIVLPGPSPTLTEKADVESASRFLAFRDFTHWTQEPTSTDASVLTITSDKIDAGLDWNELVVSWNAVMPSGSSLRVEARGLYVDYATKFYVLGLWSGEAGKPFEKTAPTTAARRESVNGQKDADGDVQTDTLILRRPRARLQLRLTMTTPPASPPIHLKFVGCSFLDSHKSFQPLESDHKAWGKVIEVPERAQGNYDHGSVICSPTSLSMVLSHWAKTLSRPDLDKDVPEVVEGVYDRVYDGTGNWPFNTAYAGAFPGMRACVSRFRDVTELEAWVARGIPVICSVSYNLLRGKDHAGDAGHLVVCVGFTKEGDIVLNDPALNPKRGLRVRTPYPRAHFVRGWANSHNTVYLVYPESSPLPKDTFGHWDHFGRNETRDGADARP